MLAATVRVTRDLDLAEECVQDAFAKALTSWAQDGVPRNPGAWLTTTARNRALDQIRREVTLRTKLPLLVMEPQDPADGFPDDRLRLVFTCCHPAIAPESQVALTLRLLCGLSTAEVARAFLVSEATMAARITRAKRKIAAARIPYRVPSPEDLPGRLDVVLAALHLLFTTGHTAPSGDTLLRHDLVERALDLTRMLRTLLPRPEVTGLLALVMLTDARRATRTHGGRLVLLEDQDRTQWDRTQIDAAVLLVRESLTAGPPGRYALQAAITAVHTDATTFAETDWREIVALYDLLLRRWPSPVVRLNRAVAVGFARGWQAGLQALDALNEEPSLATYGYLPAARADFLRRLGDTRGARTSYEEALLLTENTVERAYLEQRLSDVSVEEP